MHKKYFYKYTFQVTNRNFIDDEVLLDLVEKSSGAIHIDCPRSAISGLGLLKAFEVRTLLLLLFPQIRIS